MSAQDLDDTFNRRPAPNQAALALTRQDVLEALRWGRTQETPTKKGPRLRTTAPATPEAIDLFKREGPELYAAGYTLSEWPQGSGKQQVTKWELVPEQILVERKSAVEMSRATDATIKIPLPPGLELLPYQKAGVAFLLRTLGDQ